MGGGGGGGGGCFCRYTGMPSIVRIITSGVREVMKKMSQKSRDEKRLNEEKKKEGKEIKEMLSE